MKALGIVRKMDELGRIVIPAEIRKRNGWKEGQPLEMFIDGDQLILEGYGIDHKAIVAAEMIDHLRDKAKQNGDRESLDMLDRVMDLVQKEK